MSKPRVSSAATIDQPPDPAEWGLVVRSVGPVGPVVPVTSTAAATTNVPASLVNVMLLAANPARLGASIYNDSDDTLFIKFGAPAALNDFAEAIFGHGYYEMPFEFVGSISGIWAVASGSARVTEFT